MGSQPTHQDVISTVVQLCGDGITELEAGLKAQVDADRIKAAREEMQKAKEKAGMAEEAAKSAAEEAARL
jgi:alcohol dehydrogenase class IV